MAVYKVTSFKVTPTKREFAADEKITLRVECDSEMKCVAPSDWLAGWWRTKYYLDEIKDSALLNKALQGHHSRLPTTEIDTAHDDFVVELSNPGVGAFGGNILVAAEIIS